MAELLVALTLAALAQFGVFLDDAAAREQPAVERTLLRATPGATIAEEGCDERRTLQSA